MKPTPLMRACREALDFLNAQYGRGRIERIGLGLDEGWFEYTIPTTHYCRSKPRRRRFRIFSAHGSNKLTVLALNHQRTVHL